MAPPYASSPTPPLEGSNTSLPTETLESIAWHLPPAALAEVSQVSHRWRAVAERSLYSDVFISDTINADSQSPVKTIAFCEAVLQRPHFTDGVKELHIRWHCSLGQRFPETLDDVFRTHITNALRMLQALESLELSIGVTKETVEAWTLLQEASFPSLKHLTLNGMGGATLKLLPATFPQLGSFRGSPSTAASVVPGRRIGSLSLVGQDYIAPADMANLSLSIVPLRQLDLSSMSVTPALLQALSKHLHMVEILRVRLALRHTLHFALSGIRLLAGLTTVIGAFEHLAKLDLSPTSTVGVSPGNAMEELALCRAWGRACSSLTQIIFPSNTEWVLSMDGVWESSRGS